MITEGVRVILSAVADFTVVGVAHNGAEAVELIPQHHPDIVLMDLRMPIMNGIQATQQLREHLPEICVLVLTT